MNDELFLDERIQVVAVFDTSLHICRPIKFKRASGREVTIEEIGLRHMVDKGRRAVHMFDVTDGQSEYRLEFDSVRLVWRLTKEAMYNA
jgi:hypothetical protein